MLILVFEHVQTLLVQIVQIFVHHLYKSKIKKTFLEKIKKKHFILNLKFSIH